MTYTVDYFIEKFSRIPKEKWCTNSYTIKDRHCVFGHCGASDWHDTAESIGLITVFNDDIIAFINDGEGGYKHLGAHPRTRILNALKRVKKGLAVV